MPANKPKVLIVDDDIELRRALHVRLKANNYDTVYAADALAAMSVAKQEHPDLIILDLGLPAGDGYVVMQRLHAIPALACIPIIVLSARDAASNRDKALAAGCVAFLEKPPDNAVLLSVIRTALGKVEPAAATTGR